MPNQSTTTNTSQLQNLFSQNMGQQDVSQLSAGTQTRSPWDAVPSLGPGTDALLNTAQAYLQNPNMAANASAQILANNPWLDTALATQMNTAQQFQNSGSPIQAYQDALKSSQTPITQPMQWGLNQYQQIPQLAQQNLGALAANSSGALTGAQNQTLDDMAQRIGLRNQSLFSGAGRYGSEGAAIGTGRAIAEATNPLMAQYNQQNIQNALAAQGQLTGAQATGAGGYLGGVLQGQGQALQARSQLPGLMQSAFMPGQVEQQAGATFQSLPWQSLQNAVATFGGLAPAYSPYGTTSTQGQMNTQGNTFNQGFGQGNATGTATQTQATPWTTFAGLGLAGAGLLSDKRYKTDITSLGKDPDSDLTMYAYRYKGDPKSYPKMVGPMAQEVEKKYPWLVAKVGKDGPLYLRTA
jgi:hypothetical protein